MAVHLGPGFTPRLLQADFHALYMGIAVLPSRRQKEASMGSGVACVEALASRHVIALVTCGQKPMVQFPFKGTLK